MKKKFIGILAFFLLAAAGLETLYAIPAFARKYRMTCKTCHSPFPRLKDYGEEFAGNGFVLKDQDAPRYTVDTGDKTLSLLREIPIALRLEGYLAYNQSKSKQFEVEAPYIVKLISGGSLTKGISYYFYFFFSERGEVAGLEDAFINFTDIFGSGLGLAVGQFQVSDPLFKRELRLTFEDYQIYKTKVMQSDANLAYDRGLMFSYGFEKGPDIVFEIVNGNGIGEADALRLFDSDSCKNFMLRVSQDISDHFRIGAFGYLGREKKNGLVNALWMAGADLTVTLKDWQLNLQYMERRDDNPDFRIEFAPGEISRAAMRGGLAELIFTPKGDDAKWYSVGLFNWVDSDFDELDYRSLTFHWGLLLRRNIRFVTEFTQVLHSAAGAYPRIGVGIVTAF